MTRSNFASIALAAFLMLPLEPGGIVVRNTDDAGGVPFDKSDILFWNGFEGFQSGGSDGENCTDSGGVIDGSEDPVTMDGTKEFSAGDTTGTFITTDTTFALEYQSTDVLTGACSLRLNGNGATSHYVSFDVSSGDILQDASGCIFMEAKRLTSNLNDANCQLIEGNTASGGVDLRMEFRLGPDGRGMYDDGPNNFAAVDDFTNWTEGATIRFMFLYDAVTPLVKVYENGVEIASATTPDPATIVFNSLKIGDMSGSDCITDVGAWSFVLDSVIISDDTGRCDGTTTDGCTIEEIFMGTNGCDTLTGCAASGCKEYDDITL